MDGDDETEGGSLGDELGASVSVGLSLGTLDGAPDADGS